MKLIHLAGALALAVSLSGCLGAGGLPGSGGASVGSQVDAVKAILTDPACAHHDEIEVITGAAGIPGSFHAKAVRDCPGSVTKGAIAAPATP